MAPSYTETATRIRCRNWDSIRSKSDDVSARLLEQRVDVHVLRLLGGTAEGQVLPVSNPGHQVEAQQVGRGEDREAHQRDIAWSWVGRRAQLDLRMEAADPAC